MRYDAKTIFLQRFATHQRGAVVRPSLLAAGVLRASSSSLNWPPRAGGLFSRPSRRID